MGAYLVSVNDIDVFTMADALAALERLRHDSVQQLKLVFAPETYVPPANRSEVLGITLDQIRAITHLRDTTAHGPSDIPVNDLSADDLNCLVQALSTTDLRPSDEQAIGKFTRRKLRQLTTWPLWRAAEHKQLDDMAKQGMYAPLPPSQPLPAPLSFANTGPT